MTTYPHDFPFQIVAIVSNDERARALLHNIYLAGEIDHVTILGHNNLFDGENSISLLVVNLPYFSKLSCIKKTKCEPR